MGKLVRLIRHDWPLHFVLVATNWLPDNTPFLRLRGWLVGHFLAKCGNNLRVGRNVTFYNPSEVILGNNIYIAFGCWFMAGATINIEDEVMFGPYCVIVSSNHSHNQGSFRNSSPNLSPIYIRNGSWIGANVVITAGARIGPGAAIGAGSVVKGDIPSNVLAVGQPARVVKEFSDDQI